MTLSREDKARVAAAQALRLVLKLSWRLPVIAVILILATAPTSSSRHIDFPPLGDNKPFAQLVEESRSIEFNASEISGKGMDLGNWSLSGSLGVTELRGNRTYAVLSLFFEVHFKAFANIELRNLTMHVVSTAQDRHELAAVHLEKIRIPFSTWNSTVIPLEW